MRFGKRIVLFFLRPIFRALIESTLADISARLQRLEHLSAQLHDAEANLAAQLHMLRAELVPYLQRTEAEVGAIRPNLSAQLCVIEAKNAAQWDGIEQVLLAMFRLPESRALELDSTGNAGEKSPDGLNGVHATGNLR